MHTPIATILTLALLIFVGGPALVAQSLPDPAARADEARPDGAPPDTPPMAWPEGGSSSMGDVYGDPRVQWLRDVVLGQDAPLAGASHAGPSADAPSGNGTPPSGNGTPSQEDAVLERFLPLGDVDGDGASDLLVGARDMWTGREHLRAVSGMNAEEVFWEIHLGDENPWFFWYPLHDMDGDAVDEVVVVELVGFVYEEDFESLPVAEAGSYGYAFRERVRMLSGASGQELHILEAEDRQAGDAVVAFAVVPPVFAVAVADEGTFSFTYLDTDVAAPGTFMEVSVTGRYRYAAAYVDTPVLWLADYALVDDVDLEVTLRDTDGSVRASVDRTDPLHDAVAPVLAELTGDGVADVAILEWLETPAYTSAAGGYASQPALVAFDGTDGSELWRFERDLVQGGPYDWPYAVGDVNDDGSRDLLYSEFENGSASPVVDFVLVSGADGAVLATRSYDDDLPFFFPFGDVGGDGRAEFLLLERFMENCWEFYGPDSSFEAVLYGEAFQPVWTADVPCDSGPMGYEGGLATDWTGDATPDLAFRVTGFFGGDERVVVRSGADGSMAWEAVGQDLLAANSVPDGPGPGRSDAVLLESQLDDSPAPLLEAFQVALLSGEDGHEVWRRVVLDNDAMGDTPSAHNFTTHALGMRDVDGDGVGDVAISVVDWDFYAGDPEAFHAWVFLSGADGSLLWSRPSLAPSPNPTPSPSPSPTSSPPSNPSPSPGPSPSPSASPSQSPSESPSPEPEDHPPNCERDGPSQAGATTASNESFALRARCTDADDDMDVGDWTIDGEFEARDSVGSSPAKVERRFTFEQEGTYEVNFTARDDKGNVGSSASWTVEVTSGDPPDDSMPTCNRDEPEEARISRDSGEEFTLRARCFDPDADLRSGRWYVDGTLVEQAELDPEGDTAERTWKFHEQDELVIEFVPQDESGQNGTPATWTVTIDGPGETAAIPVFPTHTAWGLAAVGALAATFLVLRRRP